MKRFLKRFALIFGISLVIILLLAVALTAAFEGQIGRKLLTEINKQLTTELRVEKFDLSVITTFPNVSANLRGIELDDSRGGLLLEADNLSFRFGLLSLLSKSIKVKSVVVSDGALTVSIDRRGNPNYDIFVAEDGAPEEPAGEKGEEGPSISLEAAQLNNMEVIYQDESARQDIAAVIHEATFSGEFSSSQFALISEAGLTSRFVEIDGTRYLVGTDLGYDAHIFVNLDEKKYEFQEVTLQVEDNRFQADGSVEMWETGPYFDLLLNSEEGDLGGVLALLPAQYMERLGGFRSSGQFAFNAAIKGLYDDKQNPEMKVELSLDDARITAPQLNSPLKDVSLVARFDNGKFRDNSSSSFEISNLKGYFNRELLELRLRVDNLDDPSIDFLFDGVLPMDAVYGLFENPRITAGDGEIEIKGLILKGRYDDMISTSRISRVEAGGELEFDDAELTINGEEMRIDRGRLRLQDNALTVEDIKLEGAGSDITFKGSAFNLIPVLFADSVNSRRAELEFRAELTSENLDLDRLMGLSAVTEAEAAGGETAVDSLKEVKIQKREQFTNFLKGTFAARIDDYNYHLIEGREFDGLLEFNNNEMTIKGATRAMEGAFDLQGKVYFRNEPYLQAKLDCGGINVSEFFRQTENFGQEVLQDRHVSGTLNAKILIDAYWDQQGNFLDDKLQVMAGIGIEDGELAGFEMLESFSTFVKIKDLRNIKFVNMQEYLEVRKQRLYIPAMFIQSNALNLTISGEHSFENDMRYNIKVNAGQVLSERFRSYDPSLRPKQARRNGWFNLYYTIAGTIDDYEIKSAKRLVKADFQRSELRKREIELALRQEFGSFQLIEEPEEWQDVGGQEEEEFLWEGEAITPQQEKGDEDGRNSFLQWESEPAAVSPERPSANPQPAPGPRLVNRLFDKKKTVNRDTVKTEFLWADEGGG